MALSPKRIAHRKVQRSRIKGKATRGNTINFGDIALIAVGRPVWLTARHIEAARIALNHKVNRKGQVWVRVFPDKPITKKPAETRMGKGKGIPEFWASVIKVGQVLFEIGDVDLVIAEKAMRLASNKLPIATKIVRRSVID